MRVSYDPQKRQVTLDERGIDFAQAPQVFAGRHFTRQDNRLDYGERREITVGLLGQDVVVIVWTERGDSHRIISMRKADRDERAEYHSRVG